MSILDEEDEAWQLKTWAWLFQTCGGIADFRLATLVTSTVQVFPGCNLAGPARAKALLEDVQRFVRLEGHKVALREVAEEAFGNDDDAEENPNSHVFPYEAGMEEHGP